MNSIIIIIFFLCFQSMISQAQNSLQKSDYIKHKRNNSISTAYELEQDPYEGCTIGVAAGSATIDGRPLLWKTRDSEAYNNEVIFVTSGKYKFVSVNNAGYTTYCSMGVNEHGFAILNSYSPDLPGGSSGFNNGSIMYYALRNCLSVEDFQNLLDSTNTTGRRTQANFGVIDAYGAAAIFETSGNQYWKYDANDTVQAPNGYVLRTNFAINGGGNAGIERYNRTKKLIGDFYDGDTLSHKSIIRTQMRDFSDYDSQPISVPYLSTWSSNSPFGYIDTRVSISKANSVSASVIHGILPYESPLLSTMWTILGQPATAIAVPYWPVGLTPSVANGDSTAPLCDIANEIRYVLYDWSDYWYINTLGLKDTLGGGIWCKSFVAEDSLFGVTDSLLDKWRVNFNIHEMLSKETELANYAYRVTSDCYNSLVVSINEPVDQLRTSFNLDQNYPNPFNPKTKIRYSVPQLSNIVIKVFDILGNEVETLVNEEKPTGTYEITWYVEQLSSGIYFYRLQAGSFVETKKMVLMK